jgi:hypothetical protein
MNPPPDSAGAIDLPKHLLADSEDDRLFVVRLEAPRFVGEVLPATADSFEIVPSWIDNPADDDAANAAMQEAAEFYLRMVEWEDEQNGDAY